MMIRSVFLSGVIAGIPAFAFAQTSTTTEQRQTTGQSEDGSTRSTTTTNTTTVRGSVVRYEGRTIVLNDGTKTSSYTLAPSVEIPANVAVGRTITVYTDPANSQAVTRVVTTDTDEQGRTRQTAETRALDTQGNVTTTKTTNIYGTVSSYEAGKTIAILQPNGETIHYAITNDTELPGGMGIGKKVTIYTTPGTPQPTVNHITYTTETSIPSQP